MVYFLQPVDGGPVKIGYSIDVDARLKQLEAHYGRPLALLAMMDGGRDEEAEVHARFAHLRFGRTEQFRPAPDLMAFIGRPLLVDPNPDAVEAMSNERRYGTLVRLDDEVVADAKIVASIEGVSMAELLSTILGPILKKRAADGLKKRYGKEQP